VFHRNHCGRGKRKIKVEEGGNIWCTSPISRAPGRWHESLALEKEEKRKKSADTFLK